MKGYSLIEVLVAAAILAIALSSTVNALDSVIYQSKHQTHMTQAILVGEAVMEELFIPYKAGTDMSPGTHIRYYGKNGEQVISGGVYTVEWTVTADNPFPRIMKVEMKVIWNENGQTRSARFVNFKT